MYDACRRRWSAPGLVGLLIVLAAAARVAGQGPADPDTTAAPFASPATAAQEADFARGVDLDRFRLLAVQHQGRLKTLDTLARETVRRITGRVYFKRTLGATTVSQDPLFTYLDLIFRPELYHDVRLIHVRKRPVRLALTQAAAGTVDPVILDRIVDDGLVSLSFLRQPAVMAKLREMRLDLMRSAKQVEPLINAASWADPTALASLLRLVPSPQALSSDAPWYPLASVGSAMPDDSIHASLQQPMSVLGLDDDRAASLAAHWQALAAAWRAQQVDETSAALNALAGEIPGIAPNVYPSLRQRSLEHWYYRYHKMTWTWWFYLGAVILLLMSVAYRWRGARIAGAVLFVIAFGLHTVAVGVRWYLAGRIPNSNMFEAITAAAWFGAAVAILFELGVMLVRHRVAWWVAWGAALGGTTAFLGAMVGFVLHGGSAGAWQSWGIVPRAGLVALAIGATMLVSLSVARRRGSGQGLVLLGSAVVAMAALMCGRFMTVALDSDIAPAMPILNDLWLYIHTNMIIASYALIGMAFVTAALFLVNRTLEAPSRTLWLALLLPTVLMPLPALLPFITLPKILPAWLPFVITVAGVLLAHAVRGVRQLVPNLWRSAEPGQLALAGGPALPLDEPASRPVRSAALGADGRGCRPARLADVLDGATMLLLELSFITLWIGIIMGAKWADHAWGRPWGWDPKEVFALNTWIILLILVHVRLKVRDKALWTALLAVVGCSVMLFNWIVVNFFITGLHSYA